MGTAPGNWLAICLTKDDVVEVWFEWGIILVMFCCLGNVAGACVFTDAGGGEGGGGGGGGPGRREATGDICMETPDGFGEVWGGNPPTKVLGNARGGPGADGGGGGGGGGAVAKGC